MSKAIKHCADENLLCCFPNFQATISHLLDNLHMSSLYFSAPRNLTHFNCVSMITAVGNHFLKIRIAL